MRAEPFAWDEAIGFGLGVLRLSPDAFWRMTPRELAFAVRAVTGRTPTPLARATLIDLMTRYPDGRRDHGQR
ncbi:MAG: rcc01693 family protein [Xanthobacteraceae bacterium]